MWNAFFACVTVYFCVLLSVPPIGAVAWKIGAIDVPRDFRRMHKKSVPRDGGLSVFLALLLGITVFCQLDLFLTRVLIGTGILTVVGLIDDVFSISPIGKLIAQFTAAFIGVYGAPFWVATFSSVWVVSLVNAHNFIDGIDGLMAGCSAVESLFLALFLFLLGRENLILPCVLIFVSCIAFRAFNSYPASIFAGDCGSGSIGYLLGMLSLPLFWNMKWGAGWLSALFLFAYPLIDLLSAVARRLLNGKNPFCSDRAHLHHRICATGIGQIACGRILIFLSVIGAAIAAFLCTDWSLPAASLSCIIAVLFLVEIRMLFESI